MKAAVFQGARRIEIEEVPDPQVEPEGIILRVAAAGICGSDLHPYKLAQNKMIFGHEVSGEVVEVGGKVTDFRLGDRVAAVPVRPCGECYWCRQKLLLHCPRLMLPPGPTLPGAMAEYVSIPYTRWGEMEVAVRLPDNVTYEQGATVEPLGVAIYSIKAAAPEPGDTVVVLGAGTIGLAAVAALKAMGIRQVIVSGRRAGRLALARDLGADIVVDAAREDVLPVVKEATDGRGADVVLECAGVQATWDQAIAMTHRFGKVALVGIFEQALNWNPNAAIVNNISLIGILGTDARASLDMIAAGRADTMRLVTHQFPLTEAQQAFEVALTAEDAVKVLLKP